MMGCVGAGDPDFNVMKDTSIGFVRCVWLKSS